jgi:peptidoglycan/xylan/chitin deacetylase (PgdA/CDA1 family)
MCWPASSLAVKAGDDRIQKEDAAAFLAPPKREPAAFTPTPRNQRQVLRRVKLPSGQKLVALTFDLCEQPYEISGYQGGIVDFLRAQQIRATFFAGGKWILTHKQRAEQLMSDPLFEMGNHTWEHRNLRILKGSALVNEIEYAQVAFKQVREELASKKCIGPDGKSPAYEHAPKRLSLFRFPFGACNDQALEAVGEMGIRAIQWDVSSGDPWPGQKSDLMLKAVLAGVRPGSIILFHANGRGWHTDSALPSIVQALRAQGYGFVTVSELLAIGEPEYSPTCYDSRPGDTDHYDTLARRLEVAYERATDKLLSGAPARQSPRSRAQSPASNAPAPNSLIGEGFTPDTR